MKGFKDEWKSRLPFLRTLQLGRKIVSSFFRHTEKSPQILRAHCRARGSQARSRRSKTFPTDN